MSRNSLLSKLADARSGVMLFSITPPRRTTAPERVKEIAEVTVSRLSGLNLDGLIVYDIDDESDRNPYERPFPYLPTLDPASFHAQYLGDWAKQTVIYRCVGKYSEDELRGWLSAAETDRVMGVFVGASSGGKPVQTSLRRAQQLHHDVRPELPLGAVVIGERHARHGDEHLRMLTKQERGVTFFISQVVYDLNESKNLVSDYFYACQDAGITPRPLIFTLSLCGSPKTLEFLEWLGVQVPPWMATELRGSADPLADSRRETLAIARDLKAYCERLGMPYGFNVESVSIRKDEIEATTSLAREVASLLRG
ncbi:methylenetetrahydrofolate reductase [Actinoplanes solisilvae]|uniref:methylenetetrahydrofolate reductase n=1 Tax=Actinoplanes solisilvae TaxID=2486853 RepID=UPI000FDCD218|nr:5,10-methylenetetrahydrofolate reductase [Actinoplanes solisilvae]